jgi:hypothetical protein
MSKPKKKPDDRKIDWNKFQDDRGRFVKGNPGGPGSPYQGHVDTLIRAARDAVEPDVFAGIMRKMASLALQGNVKAAHFVFDRLVGRATEHVKVEASVTHQELREAFRTLTMDPGVAAAIEKAGLN